VRTSRWSAAREEAGDVLYTVLFLTLACERRGRFTLLQLLEGTRAKMIRRHPHVFGPRRADSATGAYRHWQAAKQQEGAGRHTPPHLRDALVAVWEWLRAHPQRADELRRLVTELRGARTARRASPPRRRATLRHRRAAGTSRQDRSNLG
jgi:hypothetical protein